jgi:hypothetical protein
MQDQGTAVTARTVNADQVVAEMPNEELTVALYVSDWHSFDRGLSLAEVERWVGQGLARLGPEQLWKAAYRVRKAGPAAAFPGKPHRPRRFQACVDLGWRYRWMRQDQGHPRPALHPVVYVDVSADDSTWSVPVSADDLARMTRWGSPWGPSGD